MSNESGRTFLLIMRGRTFLREAMHSFFSTEMQGVQTVLMDSAREVSRLTVAEREDVGLVLLHTGEQDVASPEVRDDLEIIRAELGSTAIVLLGLRDDPSQAAAALQAGARGYIPALLPSAIVKHALPLVASGGVFAPPFLYGDVDVTSLERHEEPAAKPDEASLDPAHPDGALEFTDREVEVLKLLGAGLPNKVIAYRLSVKEGTVKVHMRNVMRKLNVSSRTQAALIANRRFAID